MDAIGTGIQNIAGGIWLRFQSALIDIWTSIVNLPFTLIDLLKSAIEYLFVPNEEYFAEKFDVIKTDFNNKIGVDGAVIEQLGNVSAESLVGLSDFQGMMYGKQVQFMNLDWLNSYLPRLHNLARGFIFPLLVFYNLNQVYLLVRGVNLYGTGQKGGEK